MKLDVDKVPGGLVLQLCQQQAYMLLNMYLDIIIQLVLYFERSNDKITEKELKIKVKKIKKIKKKKRNKKIKQKNN